MSDDIKRRDILRGIGGIAVTGALGCVTEPGDLEVVRSAVGTCAGVAIPAGAHAGTPIPDVQGYAQKSVAAGDQIDFKISSPVAYDLSIVRLGWDTDAPNRDWVLKTFTGLPASQQYVRPGSYIWVPLALSPTQAYAQLTLECWVRPTRVPGFGTAWQGVISQYTFPNQCGFVLTLDTGNSPAFYLGDGGAFNGAWLWNDPFPPLTSREWHHLALVFNAGTAKLYIDGGTGPNHDPQITKTGLPTTVKPGSSPLRIGSYGDTNGASNFLDGDVAMPAIYSGALTPAAIYARATSTQPPVPATDPTVIGCWPLAEENGVDVADVSGCARPGVIQNHGTWMVGGPTFNAAAFPRFPPLPYDAKSDSTRGHGLRLSNSDLFDCGWTTSQSYTIPNDAKPGIYVGRITYNGGQRYDITFVVRRAAARPAAPVVVLAATNTWTAYNLNIVGNYRFYDAHPNGQPTCYQGLKTPWTSADPYELYSPGGTNYSHLVRVERQMHAWLERNGYDYDLISDFDLHANPALLTGYKALVITGHSEYWTKEAWDAVNSYLTGGGKVISASGNTMFWRVTNDGAVIECRKPPGIPGTTGGTWGDIYHQFDGKRGGLMREAGARAADAIGVDSIGIGAVCCDFKVKAPLHDFFRTPELIPGIALDAPIGTNAVGHEWDVTPQQIPGGWSGPLPNATALAQATLDTTRWNEQVGEVLTDGTPHVVSEIIDWQKPGGGRVFAAASIAIGQGLHTDDKLAAMFRNVLHADGVVVRATAMWIGTDGHLKQRRHSGTSWLAFSSGTDDLGSGFGTNPPFGTQWAPNSLAAMDVLGGTFKYKVDVGTGWGAWSDFTGGTFTGRPAAVGWGRNRLNVFGRTTGNRLFERFWDGTMWTPASGWTDVGGSTITSDPSAVGFQGRRIGVAARNSSNNIVFREKVDGSWLGEVNLGETFTSNPTLHCWSGNRLAVFGVKSNGHCLVKMRTGSTWDATWKDLGGTLNGRVQIGTLSRDTFVLYGIGTDGRVKLRLFDGVDWQPTTGVWNDTLGGTFTGELASISFRAFSITLLAVDTAGNLKHNTYDGGAGWGGWQTLATGARPSPTIFSWISSP